MRATPHTRWSAVAAVLALNPTLPTRHRRIVALQRRRRRRRLRCVWARWARPLAAPAAVGGGGGSACPRLPARPRPRLYLPNATHDATLRCATLRYAAARRRLLVFARCCCSALAPAAAAPVELAGKLRLLPRLALPLPLASPIPLLRLLAAARAARCCPWRSVRRALKCRHLRATDGNLASPDTLASQTADFLFRWHGSTDCSRGSMLCYS